MAIAPRNHRMNSGDCTYIWQARDQAACRHDLSCLAARWRTSPVPKAFCWGAYPTSAWPSATRPALPRLQRMWWKPARSNGNGSTLVSAATAHIDLSAIYCPIGSRPCAAKPSWLHVDRTAPGRSLHRSRFSGVVLLRCLARRKA